MKVFKFLETYNKAKEVFIKPKLAFYFGPWRKDPCLPIWRRGPTIYPFGYKFAHKHGYNVRLWNSSIPLYKKGDVLKNGKIAECNGYTTNVHRVKGIYDGELCWKRDFRKKLRKWKLGWIKPIYILPIWCAFHFFNYDLMWKTKWGEPRFEYPGHFTIVFFGLSFSIWPKVNDPYFYWESLLNYVYGDKPYDLKSAVQAMGRWKSVGTEESWWAFKKEFLKKSCHAEYDQIVADLNSSKDEETD